MVQDEALATSTRSSRTSQWNRMSQSEVFRPSNGPLLVRGGISEGPAVSMDAFRKRMGSGMGSRPGTSSGYRFGQLSHNSFFARHNPHPGRVRHIKGLLDVPICSVNDDGYFANPRYSLNFPPNTHDQQKLTKFSGAKVSSMPVNSINVNSTHHPINSITGLQNFLGKPMNMRVFREKAIPKMGMVPVTDAWRDELRALTEAVGIAPGNQLPRQRPMTESGRPRTSQYSAETGRLIPPPSRAMSRGPSRAGSRMNFMNKFQHITEDPDVENMILQMLCQILQTDDVNAVQSWLVSAGDREKSLVLDMIRSAMSNSDDYFRQNGGEPERPRTGMPFSYDEAKPGDMIGAGDNADRLTLDGGSPAPRPPTVGLRPFPEAIPEEDSKPMLPDVFKRPGSRMDRPATGLSRPKTPGNALSPVAPPADIRLKYTTTPLVEDPQNPPMMSFMEDDKVWQPDLSV